MDKTMTMDNKNDNFLVENNPNEIQDKVTESESLDYKTINLQGAKSPESGCGIGNALTELDALTHTCEELLCKASLDTDCNTDSIDGVLNLETMTHDRRDCSDKDNSCEELLCKASLDTDCNTDSMDGVLNPETMTHDRRDCSDKDTSCDSVLLDTVNIIPDRSMDTSKHGASPKIQSSLDTNKENVSVKSDNENRVENGCNDDIESGENNHLVNLNPDCSYIPVDNNDKIKKNTIKTDLQDNINHGAKPISSQSTGVGLSGDHFESVDVDKQPSDMSYSYCDGMNSSLTQERNSNSDVNDTENQNACIAKDNTVCFNQKPCTAKDNTVCINQTSRIEKDNTVCINQNKIKGCDNQDLLIEQEKLKNLEKGQNGTNNKDIDTSSNDEKGELNKIHSDIDKTECSKSRDMNSCVSVCQVGDNDTQGKDSTLGDTDKDKSVSHIPQCYTDDSNSNSGLDLSTSNVNPGQTSADTKRTETDPIFKEIDVDNGDYKLPCIVGNVNMNNPGKREIPDLKVNNIDSSLSCNMDTVVDQDDPSQLNECIIEKDPVFKEISDKDYDPNVHSNDNDNHKVVEGCSLKCTDNNGDCSGPDSCKVESSSCINNMDKTIVDPKSINSTDKVKNCSPPSRSDNIDTCTKKEAGEVIGLTQSTSFNPDSKGCGFGNLHIDNLINKSANKTEDNIGVIITDSDRIKTVDVGHCDVSAVGGTCKDSTVDSVARDSTIVKECKVEDRKVTDNSTTERKEGNLENMGVVKTNGDCDSKEVVDECDVNITDNKDNSSHVGDKSNGDNVSVGCESNLNDEKECFDASSCDKLCEGACDKLCEGACDLNNSEKMKDYNEGLQDCVHMDNHSNIGHGKVCDNPQQNADTNISEKEDNRDSGNILDKDKAFDVKSGKTTFDVSLATTSNDSGFGSHTEAQVISNDSHELDEVECDDDEGDEHDEGLDSQMIVLSGGKKLKLYMSDNNIFGENDDLNEEAEIPESCKDNISLSSDGTITSYEEALDMVLEDKTIDYQYCDTFKMDYTRRKNKRNSKNPEDSGITMQVVDIDIENASPDPSKAFDSMKVVNSGDDKNNSVVVKDNISQDKNAVVDVNHKEMSKDNTEKKVNRYLKAKDSAKNKACDTSRSNVIMLTQEHFLQSSQPDVIPELDEDETDSNCECTDSETPIMNCDNNKDNQVNNINSSNSSIDEDNDEKEIRIYLRYDSNQEEEDEANNNNGNDATMLVRRETGRRGVVMREKLSKQISLEAPTIIYTEDQELQQKIDFEIKMRDGTAKLLAASRHPYQLLEAAKNLLTSNTRMISYMSELQRRKTDEVMKRNSSEAAVSTPCTGTLSISDIRVPLMWKDTDYFKNKGDHRRFAVFCLLKIGTEIYDTSLVKDVDRSMPDITFDDVIVFNKVSPDFELQVEVYSHRLCDDLTMASTPRKIKKKINEISSSVGRSVGRRLSGLREDPEFFGHMIVGPKFECIADATLSLKDVSENIHTYDLVLENNSIDAAHTELPLFGNFCCRLAGQPQCMSEPVRAGALSARLSKESESAEYWASLKAGSLSCMCTESSDSTEADSTTCDNTPSEDTPTLTIPINKNTQIVKKILSDVSCIEVTNSNLRVKTRHILTFDSDRDLEGWLKALQQHVLDHVSWRHVTDASMQMKPPTPQKAPVFLRKGTQSLYQTSACDSPMTLVLKRLNVDPKSPKSGDLNSSTTSGEGGENVKSSPALTPPVMRRKGRTRLNNCGPALSLDETSSGGFSYDYNRNSESSVTTASGSSKYSSTATITSAETEASEEETKRATRSTSKTSLASTQS